MRRNPHYPDALKLRADLWRVPFLMCLLALLLFLATIAVDTAAFRGAAILPAWLSVGNVDDARAILGAMLGAVSTVLALIFSVALLVLSIAVSQFGSRILYRFIRDGITQLTIGLFLASFVHTLLALVVTREQATHQFVPQLTIVCSIALVLLSFGFLVIFSHRIAMSVQTQHVVSSIVADLDRALTELLKWVFFHRQPPGTAEGLAALEKLTARCAAEGGVVRSERSGFVQEVDVFSLIAAADGADAVVRLLYRPGLFVMKDAPLCQVLPGTRAASVAPMIHRCVTIGAHRTLKQDIEFGIAQLVEIALRAMSPAINDTFTGLTCIDWLGDELRVFAVSHKSVGALLGATGTVRLMWPPLRMRRLVKAAFDQIREAAAGNPAVSIRLLQTFRRLGAQVEDAECREALLRQTEAIWEAVPTQMFVRSDAADIEAAYLATHLALGPLPKETPPGEQREKNGQTKTAAC